MYVLHIGNHHHSDIQFRSFQTLISDGLVVARVTSMKVTHHQDKSIESLSDLFGLFHVRRYLKYQFVSGKANFVVGQNCRNVPRIRAPFGSRLKINKNSGKSKIKCNFRGIKIEGFIRLMLTYSIVFRSILLDWQGIAWVAQYLVWP